MFKLESYITPFIIGYIDKYVKLKHEDFQLSLWGGDAVLNKLDLRLDAIEDALQLPITIKSGHIHELRIHVPWTKLGSEPVVITVNTIECILKITDSTSDDRTTGSNTSVDSPKPARVAPKQQPPEQDNLPPGYLQGYIKKIMNNVNVLVNNLILKFVEDDVVLSLNVKSAELYSVGPGWERSFADIQEPELVLRRLLDLQDLTVCLDKRNASGKIDNYQEPLIYRCGLTCRIHSCYESLHSRAPYITKLSILCDKLNLSLTDVQVPMFVRLLELCLALYYGVKGQKISENQEKSTAIAHQATGLMDPDKGGESWSSWAWSYVPQILPEDEEAQNSPTERKQSVFSLGLYCTSATVIFKLTELVQDQSRYTPYRTIFKSCIRWEAQEIGLDIMVQGVNFINIQFGLGRSQFYCEGEAICGVMDTDDDKDSSFFRSGQVSKEDQVNYLTNSLFDLKAAENNQKKAALCSDLDQHLEIYNENMVLQKYGTLFIDYCYSMTGLELKEGEHLTLSSEGQVVGGRETAVVRFLFGPAHLIVSSSMVQRVHKLVSCTQHEYPPYFSGSKDKTPRTDPINAEVLEGMEKHIAGVTLHLTLFCPSVLVLPNELPQYDVAITRKIKLYKTQKKSSIQRSVLPGLLLQAQRMDLTLNLPMYPRTLVQHVSTSPNPARNMLQHCYSHKNIKVFGLEAGFTQVGEKGQLRGLCNLWQPCSGACYISDLLLPQYWQGAMQVRHEVSLEVPQVQMSVRKSQLMLLYYMMRSWTDSSPDTRRLMATSLMQDALKANDSTPNIQRLLASALMQDAIKTNDTHLSIELGSIEVKRCVTLAALSAFCSLASVSILLNVQDEERELRIPVLRGPQNTSELFRQSFLDKGVETSHRQREFFTCTLQTPTQPEQPQAVGVVVISLEGLVLLLEPELDKWLSYRPQCVMTANGDINIGQTSAPQTDLGSGSNDTMVTSLETPSLPPTHSRSCSQNVELPKDIAETKKTFSWKEWCAECYPLVKITEVQVDIAPVCVFLSTHKLAFSQLDWEVAGGLHSLAKHAGIAECLCVCLPALHLNSLAHRRMSPTQELPIRVTELSIAGEKLPWLFKVSDLSVFSILGGQSADVHYVIRPASVKATIAVSSTYHPPVSQHLSALGLAIHADSKDLIVALSHPQVELFTRLVEGKASALHELSQSFRILESICKKKVEELPAQPNVSFTRADILSKQSLVSGSTSQVDPIDPMETAEFRTVTSETGSLKLHHVMKDEEEEGTKLSLWIQCTVMKVQLKVYTNVSLKEDLKVLLESEELSCSMDVTQVYSKLITKTTSLVAMHYHRREPGVGWIPGACDGILLTSHNRISRNTYLHGEKAEKLVSMETNDSTEPDPCHSFLTVTLTKALKKNIRRKLLLEDAEDPLPRLQKSVTASGTPSTSSQMSSSLLTEVIVQMNPLDVVLNVPVIVKTLNGLTGLKQEGNAKNGTENRNHDDSVLSTDSQSVPPLRATSYNGGGCSYPLIYLNTKTVRVFMPCGEMVTSDSSDSRPVGDISAGGGGQGDVIAAGVSQSDSGIAFEKQQAQTSQQSKEKERRRADNLLVFQVCSVDVTSQPENPLPRTVVDRHLYKRALQTGILRIPGSDIEDRQYQADFNSCSVTSGIWEELVQPIEKRRTDMTAVQNPALEWNNKSSQKDTETVQLTPLASHINVRITAAPAIFYGQGDKSRVVCGHSLELNSRNDIDFLLSTSQIKLGYGCLSNNLKITQKQGDDKEAQANVSKDPDESLKSEPANQKAAIISDIPVDVLLTAGRISVALYSDDAHFNLQLQSPGNKNNLHRQSHHQSNSTLDSAVYEERSSSLKHRDLVPLLMVQFSQPHSVLSLSPTSQKLELSCYDVALKWSTYNNCRNSLPELCDFNADLLVTKPGHPDEKTGISPCLYSFRAADFIKEPAKVNLSIERAMKLNINCSEVEKMMKLCQLLQMECFQTGSSSSSGQEEKIRRNSLADEREAAVAKGNNPLKYFELIGEVDVSTKQMCVVLDTGHSKLTGKPVTATWSVNELDTSVVVSQSHATENHVSGFIHLGSVYTTVTSEGHCKPLLGPTSPSLRVSLSWDKDEGSGLPPRCVLAMKTGVIPAHFSLDRQQALLALVNAFSTLAEAKSESTSESIKENEKVARDPWWAKKETERKDVDSAQTSDDLRSGDLQYVSIETNINELPEEGEVLFSNNFEVGEAGVAWCYRQNRVITHLKSAPLPLNMPLNFSPDSVNQQLQVPCELQFWSELSQSYETCAHFTVSEQKGFELNLLEMNATPKAAKIWRVLIRQPLQNHTGYVLLQKNSETSSVATEEEDYIMVNRPDQQFIEPLVSPLTVAASLQVTSCFRPQSVPLVQLGFNAEAVRVMVSGQSDDRLPAQMSLYKVQKSGLTRGQEVITLKIHAPTLALSYTEGNTKNINCQASGGIELQVLEHKLLCKLPVLDKTDVSASMNYQIDRLSHSVEMDVNVSPFLLNIGPSVIHSLYMTASMWTQPSTPDLGVFYERYVLCNDTQEDLILGQTDTEEAVHLSSRKAILYSWLSGSAPQTLQISFDKKRSMKCEPFKLEHGKADVRTVTLEGQDHSFIIEINKHTNLQKQVVIRSTFLLASRVSETLELKLLLKRGGHFLHKLEAESSLPSYRLQPENISAIKMRLGNSQALWSQEIQITMETFKGGRLIKVPSLQSDGFIHLWCHVFQKVYGTCTQTMVVFSPLFVFKSEMSLPLVLSIDTPRLKKSSPLELPGRSTPAQLPSIAGDMIHNVSFKLSHNMKASNPIIQLSSGMIEQVRKVDVESVEVDDLVYSWKKTEAFAWPYNHLDKDTRSDPGEKKNKKAGGGSRLVEKHCVSLSEYSSVDTVSQQPAQLDIDLQVELSQCWPGCKTLLISVAPHILICNECDIDLWFIVSSETHWKLSARQTWAPPAIQGSFRLGLIVDHELHLSETVELSSEDNKARYLPPKRGLLYTESFTNVCIPVISQQLVSEVCYLTLHSTIHQNMRILTVREKLCITNQTTHKLSVLNYNIPKSLDSKVTIGNEEEGTEIPVTNDSEECEALLFWKMNPRKQQTEFTDCSQYLLLGGKVGGANQSHDQWSCPIRLPLQSPALQSLSVPIGLDRDSLVSIISQTQNGITYLVMREVQPQLVLHNECDFPIHFAEAIKETSPTAMYEEQELIDRLPLVNPRRTFKYTFPSQNKSLSDTGNKDSSPEKIHFSVCEHLRNLDDYSHKSSSPTTTQEYSNSCCHDNKPLEWSVGVDVRYNSFVTIPGSGDIKIHTEEIGRTRYVYLSSITREEISAKEIRSRIKHGGDAVLVAKAASSGDSIGGDGMVVIKEDTDEEYLKNNEDEEIEEKNKENEEKLELWQNFSLHLGINLQQAAFSLVGEDDVICEEILRMTLDQACAFVTKKRSSVEVKGQRRPNVQWNVLCGVSDFQLDNQVQKVGSFDFPVVLIKQDQCPKKKKNEFSEFNRQEKMEFFKSRDAFNVDMCLVTDLISMTTAVDSTTVNICPVNAFVEDTFVYFVLQNVELLLPVAGPREQKPTNAVVVTRRLLPKSIGHLVTQFTCPVVMQKLTIEPLSMNVSVHASIKIFLAIDNSPLSFGSFDRFKICSTSQNLVRTITMHFASGALFRAGWVVGSLELIGNPTGLVRSLAVGVSDLVSLPYQGLVQGPGAFVSGVTHGMTSFLKHISSGTILSITNFASSVSRNMERLSLDTDHRHRQEETRRHRPEGLSEGLKQGLTGFGLSVLGAVAGLADQPLQIFTRPDSDASTSNVMVGVGRGLVGVITKPVGGAAEFVSQTGIGLLQGTGLMRYPVPRGNQQVVELTALSKEGINYKVISQNLKNESALVAKGTELCANGRQQGCVLVLTESELKVVDEENPSSSHTSVSLPLKQINNLCHFGTTLYINHETVHDNKSDCEGQLTTEDRVKAFVIGASGHHGNTGKQKSKKSLDEVLNPASARLVIDLSAGSEWFVELLDIALTASKGFAFTV